MAKKITFEELVALRQNNHNEFINSVYAEWEPRDFFNGEICARSVKEVPDKQNPGRFITVNRDKYIFFTEEERRALIDKVKDKWENDKAVLFAERDERIARAEKHEYRGRWEGHPEIELAVLSSFEEDIPNFATFIRACNCLARNYETNGTFWKSYCFKGFLRWNQVVDMLHTIGSGRNPVEIIYVKQPVKLT
nr:MAG TPA: hypothetical protein [Caudoviricetes sp.]